MSESKLREQLVDRAKSLYDRGYAHGSSGNLSVRVDGGILISPTGSSLGRLDPATLSKVDESGRHLEGEPPSKESFLHLAMYQERASNGAVVHLHSTHSVAVSVLAEVDPRDALPPLTAYYVMRIGSLPLVPYYAPGDLQLADAVRGLASKHHALLLANHGPVVGGSSLAAAADAIEELEATAKLYLLVRGQQLRPLTDAQIADIRRRHPVS